MSERNTNKEHIGNPPFQYGFSISNLANETNPDLRLPVHTEEIMDFVAQQNMGVEFQIESPHPLPIHIPTSSRPAFVGVHLPIREVDFLDPQKRSQSLQYGLENIRLAKQLQADYVVTHMLTKQDWDRIDRRDQFIAEGKREMEKLVVQAKQIGYEGIYLFENLEFPLYPSTAKEIRDLQAWTKAIALEHDINTGLCLDLGHLWHTGIMIEINKDKGEVMLPYFEDPFVSGNLNFVSYLGSLTDEILDDLNLIHMTGTHIHQTHLQPKMSSTLREADRITLNLQQSLGQLAQKLEAKGKSVFVINEAHNSTYEEMADHCNLVRNYFTHE